MFSNEELVEIRVNQINALAEVENHAIDIEGELLDSEVFPELTELVITPDEAHRYYLLRCMLDSQSKIREYAAAYKKSLEEKTVLENEPQSHHQGHPDYYKDQT